MYCLEWASTIKFSAGITLDYTCVCIYIVSRSNDVKLQNQKQLLANQINP